MSPQAPADQIVIVGGGIIGLCSAYYILTSPVLPRNSTVVIIEASKHGVAQAASSSAGGFISRDWHTNPVLSLAKLSWECHNELANKWKGEQNYGWRMCGAVGLTVGDELVERSAYRILPEGKAETREGDWLNGAREDMSGTGGLAQLDPALFCSHLYAECTKLGLITHLGLPLQSLSSSRSITLRPHANPRSIISIPYTKLIVSAGPWSASVCDTLALPALPITNLPGHSVLIRPSKRVPTEAIFAGISGAEKGVHAATSGVARSLSSEERKEGFTRSPELFPRANGLVYVAGENSIPSISGASSASSRIVGVNELPHHLPDSCDDVLNLLDPSLVARLLKSAALVSPSLDVTQGAIVEKRQFCYRPITPDENPIIGLISKSVWVATGHGPWGITLSAGTGKVMAELVLGKEGPLSADISGLSLDRFSNITAVPLARL